MCGKRPNTKAQYYGLPSHMVKLEGSKSLLVNPPLCQTPCLSRSGCSSYLSQRSGVQFFTGLQHHSNKSIPSSCGNQGFLHGFVHFTFPNLNSIGWGFFCGGYLAKSRYFCQSYVCLVVGKGMASPLFLTGPCPFPLLHHCPHYLIMNECFSLPSSTSEGTPLIHTCFVIPFLLFMLFTDQNFFQYFQI